MIAALYVVLTYVSSIFGLSSGAIQLRLSEGLCVLPMLSTGAIGGLFVGCILSNMLFGGMLVDIVFGSIATLIGAVGTYLLRKKAPWIALIPPVLSNALIIPFVIAYAYGAEQSLLFMFFTVGLGEILSCGVLGVLLFGFLKRSKISL